MTVAITKCVDCHGDNLGGKVFFDAPPGRVIAPNLTCGTGGLGAQLSAADWVRAIRHGVGHDGRGLLIIPSDDYYPLSDVDLAALVAYLTSVPPVDNPLPVSGIRPLGRVLTRLGQFGARAADRIPHAQRPAPPAPAGRRWPMASTWPRLVAAPAATALAFRGARWPARHRAPRQRQI